MKLSKIFHDRPLKPLDNAVYWIEYVLRHDGAHHLKTAANKLNWFQFLSIDVILILLAVIFVYLNVVFYITKKLFRCCFKRKASNVNLDNDKKTK